ncbi:MAG: AtpZ/AtpI family protein [Planctomycetota bacterium]
MHRWSALRYAGMGLELAAAIIGLTLVGYWIDRTFDTGRVGLTIGAVLGIVGGMYNFIRQALEMVRQSDAADKKRKGP